MPDKGFGKSRCRRFGAMPAKRPSTGRFAGRLGRGNQDERGGGDIRWERVHQAQGKIAMGIYDQPAVFEMAFERMIEQDG